MYLHDYRTAKHLNDERVRRSLARSRKTPIDSYVRSRPEIEADVVEVVFGTCCESQPMGA